jgi:GTP pyrophosphokinase
VDVKRRKGIVAEIAAEVSATDAGVDNINVKERNAEISTLIIGTTVRNRSHLARLMRRLRNISSVVTLARTNN